jgi:hypothetical protein
MWDLVESVFEGWMRMYHPPCAGRRIVKDDSDALLSWISTSDEISLRWRERTYHEILNNFIPEKIPLLLKAQLLYNRGLNWRQRTLYQRTSSDPSARMLILKESNTSELRDMRFTLRITHRFVKNYGNSPLYRKPLCFLERVESMTIRGESRHPALAAQWQYLELYRKTGSFVFVTFVVVTVCSRGDGMNAGL